MTTNSDLWIDIGALTAAAQGSPNITGTGTFFQSVYPGDTLWVYGLGGIGTLWGCQIIGPDSGTILSSNTSLVLQQNWPYATLSIPQGSWAIEPTSTRRNSVIGVATEIAQFVANYGAVVSVSAQSQTGLFNKATAADNAGWEFTTAGIAKSRIGNFGDDNLHIQYSPTGSAFDDAIVVNQATGLVTINGNSYFSGKIGIGTNNPVAALEVTGPSGRTSFTGTSYLGLLVTGLTGTTDYSGIDFSETSLGAAVARIAAFKTGAGSYLQFGTSNSYVSGITNIAMTIDYNGNVGIETANPVALLDVGAGSVSTQVRINGGVVSGTGAFLSLARGGTACGYVGTTGVLVGDNSQDIGIMGLYGNGIRFYANTLEAMRIDASGNVGLGTSAPGSKLEVLGANGAVAIKGGNAQSGCSIIADNYSATECNIALGLQYSSLTGSLSYGVIQTFGAAGYVSSQGAFATARASLEMAGAGGKVPFVFLYAASATVATGTAVTMTEAMRLDSSGRLILNGTDETLGAGNHHRFASQFNALSETGFGFNHNGGGDPTGGYLFRFYNASTQVGGVSFASSTTVNFLTSSDSTLKTVLEKQRDFRAIINDVWVGDIEWKAIPGSRQLTILAQQTHEHYPDAITRPTDEDGIWQADYSKLAPLALWGVKDLYAEVAALKAEIAILKGNMQ